MLLCIVGCGCLKKQPKPENNYAMKAVTVMYDGRQLDSLCIADTLAFNYEKQWIKGVYVDYETNNQTVKYTYVKHANTKNEATYILIPMGSFYQITKRIIVE